MTLADCDNDGIPDVRDSDTSACRGPNPPAPGTITANVNPGTGSGSLGSGICDPTSPNYSQCAGFSAAIRSIRNSNPEIDLSELVAAVDAGTAAARYGNDLSNQQLGQLRNISGSAQSMLSSINLMRADNASSFDDLIAAVEGIESGGGGSSSSADDCDPTSDDYLACVAGEISDADETALTVDADELAGRFMDVTMADYFDMPTAPAVPACPTLDVAVSDLQGGSTTHTLEFTTLCGAFNGGLRTFIMSLSTVMAALAFVRTASLLS